MEVNELKENVLRQSDRITFYSCSGISLLFAAFSDFAFFVRVH